MVRIMEEDIKKAGFCAVLYTILSTKDSVRKKNLGYSRLSF